MNGHTESIIRWVMPWIYISKINNKTSVVTKHNALRESQTDWDWDNIRCIILAYWCVRIYQTESLESESNSRIYSEHDCETPNDVPWHSVCFILIVWCIYVCCELFVVSLFFSFWSLANFLDVEIFCHDTIDNSLSRCTSSREYPLLLNCFFSSPSLCVRLIK